MLTGTNIGSYGEEKSSSLGKLLQKLGSIKGIKRIRLGSIEPSQIDEAGLNKIALTTENDTITGTEGGDLISGVVGTAA